MDQKLLDRMYDWAQRNPWYGHLVKVFVPQGWYVEDFAGNNYGIFKEFPTMDGRTALVLVAELGASVITHPNGDMMTLDEFVLRFADDTLGEDVLNHNIPLIERDEDDYHGDLMVHDALIDMFDANVIAEITEAISSFNVEYWKGGGY